MRRTLRPPAALATITMVAVISAGCAGTPSSGGTGGGGGTSAAATSEKAVKFAQCMRANGVSGFPDPSASGSFTIDGVANGSSLDLNSAAFKRAMSACRNLEPPGFTGPKVTPQQTVTRLKFAQCVRDNGVPDFPDPTQNGPLVDTNRIPSAATPGGMSALNAAMHTCGALYSGELGLKGK
ncbi:MAG TPA: hypothetical protein VNC40_08270 [Gaiellaceae bacterium]|nr:hypothetical protein [Gaiellaceae bacterium]